MLRQLFATCLHNLPFVGTGNVAISTKATLDQLELDVGRFHDARVIELLEANNREVDRRREAEEKLKIAVEAYQRFTGLNYYPAPTPNQMRLWEISAAKPNRYGMVVLGWIYSNSRGDAQQQAFDYVNEHVIDFDPKTVKVADHGSPEHVIALHSIYTPARHRKGDITGLTNTVRLRNDP